MSRISIIIPVYNTEKYIEECAYSVYNQMSNEDELILIDDGSSDNSRILCDKISRLDNRIKVIHKKNEGVTIARKTGVDIAKGKWIMFVDADDTLPNDAIENLYKATQIYDTEIIIGFPDERKETNFSSQISLEDYRVNNITGFPLEVAPWGKLILRELFNSNTFNIPRFIIRGEDMLMNLRLSFNMHKKPVVVFRKVYNYRNNLESVSHTFKESYSYEEKFHEIMKQSIPTKEFPKYEVAYIIKRLNLLKHFYNCNPLSSDWINSHLYTELISDINRIGYKMTFIDKIKFKGNVKKNRVFVYILIKIYNLLIRMYNKLFLK